MAIIRLSIVPRNSDWARISELGYLACQTCIMFVDIISPVAAAAKGPPMRRPISTARTTASTPITGVTLDEPPMPRTRYPAPSSADHRW